MYKICIAVMVGLLGFFFHLCCCCCFLLGFDLRTEKTPLTRDQETNSEHCRKALKKISCQDATQIEEVTSPKGVVHHQLSMKNCHLATKEGLTELAKWQLKMAWCHLRKERLKYQIGETLGSVFCNGTGRCKKCVQ